MRIVHISYSTETEPRVQAGMFTETGASLSQEGHYSQKTRTGS